jgi:hypothetical protein
MASLMQPWERFGRAKEMLGGEDGLLLNRRPCEFHTGSFSFP